MVDIWFTFIMTIPFMEVILHTTKDQLRTKSEVLSNEVTPFDSKFTDKNLNILTKLRIYENIGKYFLPITFVVFSTIFFSIGMCLKYKVPWVLELINGQIEIDESLVTDLFSKK